MHAHCLRAVLDRLGTFGGRQIIMGMRWLVLKPGAAQAQPCRHRVQFAKWAIGRHMAPVLVWQSAMRVVLDGIDVDHTNPSLSVRSQEDLGVSAVCATHEASSACFRSAGSRSRACSPYSAR